MILFAVFQISAHQQVDSIPTFSLPISQSTGLNSCQWKNWFVTFDSFTHHLLALQDTLCSIKHINLLVTASRHPIQCFLYFCLSTLPQLLQNIKQQQLQKKYGNEAHFHFLIPEESSLFSMLGPEVIFKIPGLVPNQRIVVKGDHYSPSYAWLNCQP